MWRQDYSASSARIRKANKHDAMAQVAVGSAPSSYETRSGHIQETPDARYLTDGPSVSGRQNTTTDFKAPQWYSVLCDFSRDQVLGWWSSTSRRLFDRSVELRQAFLVPLPCRYLARAQTVQYIPEGWFSAILVAIARLRSWCSARATC